MKRKSFWFVFYFQNFFYFFFKLDINFLFYLQHGPNLQIDNVQISDAGKYICFVGRINVDVIENENDDSSWIDENDVSKEIDFFEARMIILKVRSTPGPVTRLSVRLSTILGVLTWEFPSNHSGGHPIKSFTAEYRQLIDDLNQTEHNWHRYDPQNIPGNVVKYF